ncbi:hypothetical protein K432DRAFT_295779 [Lepidopterella palustris CBS 459.81]|uniref:Vacuolar protein sorting-associated protein 51 homolog n=1 Tax=Lepidopterella palustris CBS 459.81 TaxID=1314670 RepID=A0A8E2EC94_9PEZI|nr:hypothetical protein K432DRAFT_295779 [Lepidopterella palustris CBS 459.81]
MSTIASPRASTSIRSPSSSRTSLEAPASRPTTTRRNRAALRDYYGLKGAATATSTADGTETEKEDAEGSELDKEGFDSAAYVKDVLAKQGLEGVLRVEGSLVSEIRNLDGERKALVYDNYSKLIAATDTIRKMRSNMDPLAPTTSTLSPAISHIAETAASLSASLLDRTTPAPGIVVVALENGENVKKKARETVKWALDTPRRLEEMIKEGKSEEAVREWEEVSALLLNWRGVKGVQELREQCECLIGNTQS